MAFGETCMRSTYRYRADDMKKVNEGEEVDSEEAVSLDMFICRTNLGR